MTLRIFSPLLVFCFATTVWSQAPTKNPPGFVPRWYPPGVTQMPTDKMGPFVRLPDGKILTVDRDAAYHSADEGITWSAPMPLFSTDAPGQASDERGLLVTKSGAVVLACMDATSRKTKKYWDFEKNEFPPDLRLDVVVLRSEDGGRTWSKPQVIQQGYSGCTRGLIQAADGNLVLTTQDIVRNPARHATKTYYSTDDGRTWTQATYIDRDGVKHDRLDVGGHGHHDGSIEATVVKLKDDRIWMLLRTGLDVFYQAFSSDHGVTWTDFGPTTIDASSAPGQLHRLASGRLMLVWNRLYPEGQTTFARREFPWSLKPASGHRDELSVALSDDDGKTWTKPRVVVRAAGASLSYPYLFERVPGEVWISTMQSGARIVVQEKDFLTEKP